MRNRLFPSLVLTATLVACNDVPTGAGVAIEPESPTTVDDLQAVITAPSEDRHEVSYIYAWSRNGADVGIDAPTVPSSETRKGETWEVLVTPTDGKVSGESSLASVTVLNTAPTLTLSLLPTAPTTQDDLVATASTEDLDEDGVEVRWSWTVDGAASTVNGGTVRAPATRKGQVWEVTATPYDGEVEGEPVTAQVVIGNEVPVAEGVTLSPDDPRETSTIVASASGSDIDGDDLTWTYTWFVGPSEVLSGSQDSIDGSLFNKGDTVIVEAFATDGDDVSNTILSTGVVVLNTPPVIGSVSVDPPDPAGGEDLSCLPEGVVDADDDTVTFTYAWTVDGVESGTDATLAGEGLSRGQRVSCTVTPYDGEEYGDPVRSDPVTIANTVPVVASVSVTPSPASTADDVTAVPAGVFDADGDRVAFSYNWSIGGSTVGTSSILAAGAHRKGDVVTLTVTPNDGFDDGSPASTSFTVANAAPTTPVVEIDPGSPSSSDDLLCDLVVDSTDPDGDRLTRTITWTLDGRTWTGATTTTVYAGDTIASANVDTGDLWSCSVSVTDGAATVTGSSATVEVADSKDFVLFTTNTFIASGVSLASRSAANAKCASEASLAGISGSNWKIVYSTASEDAKDYVDYDADRGDRVYNRAGTRIDGGDLWGSSRVTLSDLKSWTITGTNKSGEYTTCSGSYPEGSWPICQYCSQKFACASSTDDPFAPSACCWTGSRAVLCMGEI